MVHGGIDGFSRLIVFNHCSINKLCTLFGRAVTYQMARHVHPQCGTSAIMLKDVKIQLCSGYISISEATNFSCIFHMHGIDYNTSVLQCNAVESDDGQLINVGNFVRLKQQRTTMTEVSFVSISSHAVTVLPSSWM